MNPTKPISAHCVIATGNYLEAADLEESVGAVWPVTVTHVPFLKDLLDTLRETAFYPSLAILSASPIEEALDQVVRLLAGGGTRLVLIDGPENLALEHGALRLPRPFTTRDLESVLRDIGFDQGTAA